MPIAITPLLSLDPDVERMDTDDLVDLVRLDVPAVAASEAQAIEVLTRLGLDRHEAWKRVRTCTGKTTQDRT